MSGRDGDWVLRARGLCRSFGPVRALRGVDLTLRAGEFWSVFGPNGAGKSTLLGLLAGLLRPTAGALDCPGGRDGLELRRRLGMVSHQTFLYGDLTASENLAFFGALYGIRRPGERVRQALEEVGLSGRADSRADSLSRGMQQRLAIARALLHRPTILLLDEPFTGLDRPSAERLVSLLESLKTDGRTLVMTTHDLELGWRLCTHAAVFVRGRLSFRGPREETSRGELEAIVLGRVGGGSGRAAGQGARPGDGQADGRGARRRRAV